MAGMSIYRCAGPRSLVLLAGLLPLPLLAASAIQPSVTVAEIYTNNVDLAPSGQEEDEWVTRLAPRINLIYEGTSLQATADYTLEALFYANDSDRNEVYNQLNSAALLDLIGKDLQLRGAAVINQVNLAPEQPVSNSNINTTGNRSDATTWNLGPQWHRDVLGNSEIEGYATIGQVNYDARDSQDVDTVSGRFALQSSRKRRPTVGYELAYEYDKVEYELSGDTVVQTAYLQLGYQVNTDLELFVLGGLDNDIEDPTDDSLSEGRWEAGFSTNIGASHMRAAVGHRYFGPTYSFLWELEDFDSTYRISYSEAPTTSDLTAVSEIPTTPATGGGTTPTPPPDSDLARPGNPTRFILRRGDALGSWQLHRTELSVGLFWEERQDQVFASDQLATTADLSNEESYGFDAGLSWEIGAKSVASLTADWRHREYNDLEGAGCDPLDPAPCTPLAADDELTRLIGAIDYTLGLKTGLGFRLGWQRRGGAADGSSDYDELWGSVQLLRKFY